MPRSLASAASPLLAGYLLALSTFGWPLVVAGGVKIAYDLLLLAMFRRVRPPEEAARRGGLTGCDDRGRPAATFRRHSRTRMTNVNAAPPGRLGQWAGEDNKIETALIGRRRSVPETTASPPPRIAPETEEARADYGARRASARTAPTARCARCVFPSTWTSVAVARLDGIIHVRTSVRRKAKLYRPGDRFVALYAIRLGTFKTTVLAEDGCQQVTGYHMAGEIIGLDGIGDERHSCDATALEDSEVCVARPWNEIDRLAADMPELRRNLYRVISRDASREQAMMLLLGSRTAGERLAIFLLNVADRYRDRGYSSCEFVLRMTREEIASYLGLKLETVSRLFSSLQENGLLQVQGRAVKLLDVPRLRLEVAARA